MLGGGFMGQMHQTNKENREMLKKHKKDKKEFLSGVTDIKSDKLDQDQAVWMREQQALFRKELEARKNRQKILSILIFFGAIALAVIIAFIVTAT